MKEIEMDVLDYTILKTLWTLYIKTPLRFSSIYHIGKRIRECTSSVPNNDINARLNFLSYYGMVDERKGTYRLNAAGRCYLNRN